MLPANRWRRLTEWLGRHLAASRPQAASTARFGWSCVGCFAAHASVQAWIGIPHNLLWICHIACLMTGVGLLLRSAALAQAGLLLLVLGNPMWIGSLLTGGEFYPTSVLTHLGGLVFGWCGLRSMMPKLPSVHWTAAVASTRKASRRLAASTASWRQGWLFAVTIVAILLVISRGATPPELNVNLVFAPWCSLPDWLESDEWYVAMLWCLWVACLWGAARLLRLIAQLDQRPTRT